MVCVLVLTHLRVHRPTFGKGLTNGQPMHPEVPRADSPKTIGPERTLHTK